MAPQRRSMETREGVVVAAARLFARAGYKATTLSAITRELQATQGSVYFHFHSKQDLAVEIIRRQRDISSRIARSHISDPDAGLTGIVRLAGDLAHEIHLNPIVQAGMRLTAESGDDLLPDEPISYTESIVGIRRLFDHAHARGELREDLDLDAAAETVVATFRGALDLSYAHSKGEDLLSRLGSILPVLLHSFTSTPELARSLNAPALLAQSPTANHALPRATN